MEAWAILRGYHRNLGQLPASICDWDAPVEKEDEGAEKGEIEGDLNGYVYGEDDGEDDEDVVVPGREANRCRSKVWYPKPSISTTKRPRRRPASYLIDQHGATNLIKKTIDFLKRKRPHHAHRLPKLKTTHHFYSWTRCRLSHGRLPFLPSAEPHVDHIRAVPASYDDADRMTRFGSFDTVLFLANPELQGLHRESAFYSQFPI